jgi:DNA-binding NarL/FixJ family response regulator
MQFERNTGTHAIRVLVADSSRIHTQLLADALQRIGKLEAVCSALDTRDLGEDAQLDNCHIAIVSANFDGDASRGFEFVRSVRASRPSLRVIVLADAPDREWVLEAFRAGARGIFKRDESVEALCKCINSVYEGQIWATSEQMGYAVEALAASPSVRAVDANGFNLLTKRELQVVQSLAEGLTNREIAERLGLSQHTIKNYLFRIFDKVGVSSRIELLFMTLSQAGSPLHPTNNHGAAELTFRLKAAQEGFPGAQFAVARMFDRGEGTARDLVLAYMWYYTCEHSSDDCKKRAATARRKLASILTAEEITAAEQNAAAHIMKKTPSYTKTNLDIPARDEDSELRAVR